MVDTTMIPAIKLAIRTNELGRSSPYVLSFACRGQSGASFGIFQGDTNVNPNARAVLRQALTAAGVVDGDCDTIISAVSKPCPDGNPLSAAQTTLVNNALSSAAGTGLVDAMDANLLNIVLGELDSSIAAATSRSLTLAAAAQLYICLWANMTGAPNTLNRWLGGTQELGVVPPIGPIVTRLNLESYLHASSYFQLYPQNFLHMSDSVDAGLTLAPPGT